MKDFNYLYYYKIYYYSNKNNIFTCYLQLIFKIYVLFYYELKIIIFLALFIYLN